MAGIGSGRLNERIEIWQLDVYTSDYGDTTQEWKFVQNARAFINHSGGGREVVNDEILNTYTKEFTVRQSVDVKDTDRIKWNNRFYQVTYIEPDRSRMTKIISTKLVNETQVSNELD